MTATWFDSSRLPTSWKTLPLRRVGRIVNGGTPTADPDNWDGQYPFVTPPDLNGADGAVIESTARTLSTAGTKAAGIVPAGSILVSTRAPIGHVGRVGTLSTFNQGCKAVTPNIGIDPGYIATVLVAARAELIARGQGATFFELSSAAFAAITIPLPPFDEQRAIADYLDQETAQIDALVAKQVEFIGLLRERRTSLVSSEMSRSLGKPTPLRRIVDVIDCAHVTAEFVDGDERFPVASIRECQGEVVDLANCKYTTAEFYEHLRASGRAPRVGDLLFIRNVSVGLVAAVAPGTRDFAVGQETVLLRRKAKVDSKYLRHALISAQLAHEIEGAMIGSTFRRINVAAIRSLSIPLPRLDEQIAIARRIDEATVKIDALIAKAEEHIALAKERRSALITAAVTGQFDVRTAKKGARV